MSSQLEPSNDPNGVDVTKRPFKFEDGKTYRWFREEKPHKYVPTIVEVASHTHNIMKFQFLNFRDGTYLGAVIEDGDLNDASRMYGYTPSTAQDVDPNQAEKCGFLFITKDYGDELIKAGKITESELSLATGTGKWPKGAGTLASALRKLLRQPAASSPELSPDEVASVRALLSSIE